MDNSRRWRLNNPEKDRESHRASKKRHREHNLAYNREWRRKNHEHANARDTAYRHSRPMVERVYALTQRQRKKGIIGVCTHEQIEARFRYHGNRCVYCKAKAEHVDHMIPVCKGGTNWPSNLVPACKKCNMSKNKRTYKEFMIWKAAQGS